MSIGTAQTAAAISAAVFGYDTANWSKASGITELYYTIAEFAADTESLYEASARVDAPGVYDYDVGEEIGHFIGKAIEAGTFTCYKGYEEVLAEIRRLINAYNTRK